MVLSKIQKCYATAHVLADRPLSTNLVPPDSSSSVRDDIEVSHTRLQRARSCQHQPHHAQVSQRSCQHQPHHTQVSQRSCQHQPHHAQVSQRPAHQKAGQGSVTFGNIWSRASHFCVNALFTRLCAVLAVCPMFMLSPNPHAIIARILACCYNCG